MIRLKLLNEIKNRNEKIVLFSGVQHGVDYRVHGVRHKKKNCGTTPLKTVFFQVYSMVLITVCTVYAIKEKLWYYPFKNCFSGVQHCVDYRVHGVRHQKNCGTTPLKLFFFQVYNMVLITVCTVYAIKIESVLFFQVYNMVLITVCTVYAIKQKLLYYRFKSVCFFRCTTWCWLPCARCTVLPL